MLRNFFLLVSVLGFLSGCAQVPKQSIELSATLGRDLTEVQAAHLKLVDIYFAKIESDTNHFVDNVYAPYQIQKTLSEFQVPITRAIEKGAASTSNVEAQKEAIEFLSIYLTEVRNNIEQYRAKHLAPIRAQQKLVVQQLNSTYLNMQQANTVLTGYLSSVVQVKDMQNEVLAKLGAPNLQNQISTNLSNTAEQIENLNQRAASGKEKVADLVAEFDKLKSKIEKK
ncbi:hypothetical protein Undi14_01425 [Undibacterium sp. 14-3-2]|uniref:hypothetical protein n=1 Tax=Undibacterium sp. 14-3-2 TaxID=2800129 RepID=UPI0019046766|nr:hypothetical protein [Undibacterium sp. 14-3-2]MBK1888677.1 hypothetical protein [Undibacterium sp. 14-3-2]